MMSTSSSVYSISISMATTQLISDMWKLCSMNSPKSVYFIPSVFDKACEL